MDNMFLRPKKKAEQAKITLPPVPTAEPISTPLVQQPPLAEAVPKTPENTSPISNNTAAAKPPKKASWWKRTNRKKKLIVFGPILFVLLGSGTAALVFSGKKEPVKEAVQAQPEEKPVEEPKPTTVPSKLTGVQVSPETNTRGVTGIMIENSLDARPQSGLLEAGVVYEAIAEGGITRFLALFQEAQPAYIGPVRSARPYYIEWLLPYAATYAHAGGSPEALNMISSLGVKDMDHGANGASYQRVDTRFAPHNLYTSMANLDAIRTKKQWGNPEFTGLERKADAPGKTLTATAIDIKISSVLFNVRYDYDAASNSYFRSLGGKIHTDEKSGKQLQPKVVVALVIPYSIHPDGVHSKYQTIGTGQAFVFQDGTYQEATWSKASAAEQLVLKDTGGRVLGLNAGQTWFSVVGQAGLVTYSGPPQGATP